jgi:hypothetical protein
MAAPSESTEAQRVLEALVPIWALPGLFDYVCHRRSKIERTSGTHESMTHLLMSAASGFPVLLSLLCETTPSVALASIAAVAVHEAIVLWDVGYANPLRTVSPAEQHVHAFLEVLPFTMLALNASAHPAAYDDLRAGWPLRFKRRRRPPGAAYFALVAALGVTSACAYAEEFVRCYRVDRTIAPHRVPIDEER